jgi:luciferase family oxidoreductase group 1
VPLGRGTLARPDQPWQVALGPAIVNFMQKKPLGLVVLDMVDDVKRTVEVATVVEALGFNRYWITDHPPQPSPELVVNLLACLTDDMRIGTAGVLITCRNPLQVAQNFLLLEDLFPGRIDAGFCAGGAKPALRNHLLEGKILEEDAFTTRALQLMEFLRTSSSAPDDELIRVFGDGIPEIWLFGTGTRSARLAAESGTAFGYSLFHQFSKDDPSPMQEYRARFQAQSDGSKPIASLAFAGVLADTEERANALLVEHTNEFIRPSLVGTYEQCRRILQDAYLRYSPDELIFLDVCHRAEDKVRSYEIFRDAARALDLG